MARRGAEWDAPSQETLRIDIHRHLHAAAHFGAGGEQRAQKSLHVGRARGFHQQAEAVAAAQQGERRLGGAEHHKIIIARQAAERRHAPAPGRFHLVSGAGKGRGLVQTWQPDHPVIRALLSGEPEKFYAAETAMRESAGLPPFGRLAALIISGNDRVSAEAHARALARAAYEMDASERWSIAPLGGLPGDNDLIVLGPAEAPLALLRGRHRFRLLVKAPRAADMQGFLRALLAAGPKERGGVRVAVDVDPQSFL